MNRRIPFRSADILLPVSDPQSWAVVACDQFTSEPEYWDKADAAAADKPSALRIILPEVYLDEPDVENRIEAINKKMNEYLSDNVLKLYPDAMIYVERTISDGRVRKRQASSNSTDGTLPPSWQGSCI